MAHDSARTIGFIDYNNDLSGVPGEPPRPISTTRSGRLSSGLCRRPDGNWTYPLSYPPDQHEGTVSIVGGTATRVAEGSSCP